MVNSIHEWYLLSFVFFLCSYLLLSVGVRKNFFLSFRFRILPCKEVYVIFHHPPEKQLSLSGLQTFSFFFPVGIFTVIICLIIATLPYLHSPIWTYYVTSPVSFLLLHNFYLYMYLYCKTLFELNLSDNKTSLKGSILSLIHFLIPSVC